MSDQNLSIENERLLLQTGMGISSSDTLFIIYIPRRKVETFRFVERARNLGSRVTSAPIEETVHKGDKLPDPVLAGFSSASVILLVVSPMQNQIFGHHPVKDQAVERGGGVGWGDIAIGKF